MILDLSQNVMTHNKLVQYYSEELLLIWLHGETFANVALSNYLILKILFDIQYMTE